MQSVRKPIPSPQLREEAIFFLMSNPSLMTRFGRECLDLGNELSGGLAGYLRSAFLPDRIRDWFPLRLASSIGTAIAHPLDFVVAAASTDPIGQKRRARFVPVLTVSAAVHGVLIVYLLYLAIFSPFAGLRVVNRAYRQFDPSVLTVHLKYPPQLLKAMRADKAMSLEEIRKRAEKQKEELARKREREEKERAEREKREQEKKEAEQKAAELAEKEKAKNPANTQFGEINEAPIRDLVGQFYALYTAGDLEVNVSNLSMMATFKIEKDGSLSNIKIVKSSGNKLVDEKAAELLWMIGESHALGPISDLSSGSIKLDLTEARSRLTITAFAVTPDVAKAKADLLNLLFFAMRMKKNSPDVAELLSLIRIKSDNKRVDAELSVSRARAAAMMNARFGSNPNP